MRAPLILLGVGLTAWPLTAAAAPQSLPPIPYPPRVALSPHRADGDAADVETMSLLRPTAQATCDGEPVHAAYSDDLAVQTAQSASAGETPDTVIGFSIAEDGRTLEIKPVQPAQGRAATAGADVQAALAAWRFASGARRDCLLTVSYSPVPIAEASSGDLLRYFAVTRTTGPIRDAVANRLAGPEANCGGDRRGGRRPRTVSYPDNFIGQRPPPGGKAWTVVRWNINAQGRATNIQTLGSSGDRAFDAETRRAVAATVVAAGPPRKGCVYNFHRIGPVLPAPAMPDRPDEPLASCPADVRARLQIRPNPETYPKAFGDRQIEGWALVQFDVATWGQLGNVTLLDAQPAWAFGQGGMATVRSARVEPGTTPGVGCIVPVRYHSGARETDQTTQVEASTD
ncbi:energy transducer TonB family protein [Brevundimonas nasdae]|uniref:TonB family protein n=1 Tax=Brevundimonas nasdae TaxID=172043 RepID=A0ABX8TD16_9CAUL|nr:energy transducer TonB [Brevundimonas nasdae]QYC09066.1 TonB family protein [Brevundimonas nasdae]QYC15116.1 TonB family protein [Brevundimonas nasdae]